MKKEAIPIFLVVLFLVSMFPIGNISGEVNSQLLLTGAVSNADAPIRKTSEAVRPLTSLSTSSTPPPLEWNQTYGATGTEEAYSVVQTGDGGYVLAGYTNSSGNGGDDFWLVKTDSAGNMQWNQTYGGVGDDVAYSVVQTGDGGYVLAGYTNSSGNGGDDFWLVKVDSAGGMQWNQTYGATGTEEAYSVVQTSDGGYALAGYTNSSGNGGDDFWLVKTNPTGGIEWSRPYGGTGMDRAYSVVQTSDEGYALAGETSSYGAGGEDFWLVKTNPTGGIEWSRPYGGIGIDRAYSVVQTSDGGYALAGETYSYGAGFGDSWLVKTNPTGGMQWNQTYGGDSSEECAYSVVQTADGYALAGYTMANSVLHFDFWLVKTDSAGNMQWNQTYGGVGDDVARSLVQTGDGGYALAGYTDSYGNGASDFYLVKARLCTLTVSIQPPAGGTTYPSPGTHFYSVGTVVTVNATSYANYLFESWLLDGFGNTTNPIIVTMNANRSLQAVFKPSYTLTINATAGGTTIPTPGAYVYTTGTVVTVNATSYANYLFESWLLDGFGNTTNPIIVTMNANRSLQAVFKPSYTLTINATAGGTTIPSLGTYIYSNGTVINVTAFPNIGYYLNDWELDGNNVGEPNPINITMDMNYTLKAFFSLIPYALTISATAGGTTIPSGTGSYSYGTVVNVTASPNTSYYFDHWELDGVNVGAVNPINVTMYKSYSLYAVFEPGSSPAFYILNVTVSEGGTTIPSPGTYIYSNGTVVSITASPDTFSIFDHWELDGNYAGATNLMNATMNTDHALYAAFLPHHDVAVTNVTSPKTVVGQGFNHPINLTVINQGSYTETINMTVYANDTATSNSTSIATFNNVVLTSGVSWNPTLYWNTAGFVRGNYTISAEAELVPGETDPSNNNFTDGWVVVAGPGDIASIINCKVVDVPDGKVDMMDLGLVARFFLQTVPPAPANCDVTGPTGVPDGTINMRDVGLVARYFGTSYP